MGTDSLPIDNETPPDTQPTGPIDHLNTVEYWRDLYKEAIVAGKDLLAEARRERVWLADELVGLRGGSRQAWLNCARDNVPHAGKYPLPQLDPKPAEDEAHD